MNITEHNIDGLIGPTHFFGGLGLGNVASQQSAGNVSYPKAAALQGLEKMKLLYDLGIPQLVMPPHPRPALFELKRLGYNGSAAQMIAAVVQDKPDMLPIIYSSSAMWTANAATISASSDTADGKIHMTPANLTSNAHRRLEAAFTTAMLKRMFAGSAFVHHAPLPDAPNMRDEGAANHMHVVARESAVGLNIFVYGAGGAGEPANYIARQHKDASQHIAAQHRLSEVRTLFIQQHPEAIDAGVFHNDVIATSHGHAIFYHERAFVDEAALLQFVQQVGGVDLYRVAASELSLAEAVSTYLFNSQVVSLPSGGMAIIAPRQCEASGAVQRVISGWIADESCPITAAIYVDVDQSMANGGGPACLRLRMWMTEAEAKSVHPGVRFSDALYERLGNVIDTDYPDSMTVEDLHSPTFPARVLPIFPKLAAAVDMPDLYDGWM